MDKQAILDKQREAAEQFEKLKQEGEQHRSQITKIEDELKKLQGKWQGYQEIIESWVEKTKKKAENATK